MARHNRVAGISTEGQGRPALELGQWDTLHQQMDTDGSLNKGQLSDQDPHVVISQSAGAGNH